MSKTQKATGIISSPFFLCSNHNARTHDAASAGTYSENRQPFPLASKPGENDACLLLILNDAL